MITFCTSAVTVIQRAPNALRETPLEETAKGGFCPARISWTKLIASAERMRFCASVLT